MASKTFKIIDPAGLHARPASVVVQEATKFNSEITLEFNGKTANLKSIMSVMALVVKTNEEIKIVAEGDDAEAALNAIENTLKEKALIE